jgi:hypothetical protein
MLSGMCDRPVGGRWFRDRSAENAHREGMNMGRWTAGEGCRPTATGLALVLLASAILGACASPATTSIPGVGIGFGLTGGAAATIPPDATADWPASAPADVPAFPGTLENLMTGRQGGGPGSGGPANAAHRFGARLFFAEVPRASFDSYLAVLRAAGYVTDGVVYYSGETSEGEAKAQQRAASGEFDAVIATRSPRILTITVPGADGGVTFDLDGLTEAENAALDVLPWPAAWADRIPAPAGCHIGSRGIIAEGSDGIQLECTYDATDPASRQAVLTDYVAVLVARGFAVTQGSANDSSVELRKDRLIVTIAPQMGGVMSFHVVELPSTTNGWPDPWAAKVPPPDGCTIGADGLEAWSPGTMAVSCAYPDADPATADRVTNAYAAKLVAAGFVEQPAPTGPGDPSQRTFIKGQITVWLMPRGLNDTMGISASEPTN